ncbi:hypothetical protein R1sor_010568 [Riccia sorocarpa]|uniref:C2H2-type domain-containing protein n=1 Tax=Riccia sorocarpa TaxID=122646 RepID=A0ABD3I244_9MARC
MGSEPLTLADVQTAVGNGLSSVFERVPVYVVGFEAPCAWPRKYTYRACNVVTGDGRHCLKSAERRTSCSDRHVWSNRRPVYRFQLKLCDGSMHGRTLKTTVFNNISVMLKRSASEFTALPVVKVAPRLAVAGRHYQIYRRTKCGFLYVRWVGECARNARNLDRFVPHMENHGFCGVDLDANAHALAELKPRIKKQVARHRRRKPVPKSKDFLQLGGSIKAAWVQTCRRKWKMFVAEAEESALFRFGPEPKAPEQTIFTILIDCLLLLDRRTDAGFWAERWNFDLQDCVLTASQTSLTVYGWCDTVETQLRLQEDQWPTPELSPKVRVAMRALKGIFPQVLPTESEVVRSFMQPIRVGLIKSGLEHMAWLKATIEWLQNCSSERMDARAKILFEEWLKTSKATVVNKLRYSLVQRFSRQFGVSEEEVAKKVRLDELFYDLGTDTSTVPDSADTSESELHLWVSTVVVLAIMLFTIQLISVTLPAWQPSSPTPYHLVRDRKGRRVILCSVSNCVEAFLEIPSFNSHLVRFHGRDAVRDADIHRAWKSMTATSRRRLRRELGPQDSIGNCLDFIRLRGTLAARWRISKRRKFKRLMTSAMEFKENRVALSGNPSDNAFEYIVRATYRSWKRHEKDAILARLRANLLDTLMTQYNLTEDEAIQQGQLDETIVDTSDDES